MVDANLLLTMLALGAPPDLADRWLVITRTETKPGAGLVETTPYAGLRPNLYIDVGSVHDSEKVARAACQSQDSVPCYVKFAGPRIDAAAAKAAAEKAPAVARQAVSVRGTTVWLVVGGTPGPKVCEEGAALSRTVDLYLNGTPRRIGTFETRARTCCQGLKAKRAPKGLAVFEARCESPSCGGACLKDRTVVIVVENDLTASVARQLECTEDLSVPPDPHATCDALVSDARRFRLVHTSAVTVTPCPDQPEAWDRITAEVETTRYKKGRLVTRTSREPHLEGLWGCE